MKFVNHKYDMISDLHFSKIKTFKSLKEVMEPFLNVRNFKSPKKVMESFFGIKNLKDSDGVFFHY